MKVCRRSLKSNSSGQLLVIAALAIALLISTTTVYVYELSKETYNSDFSSINDSVHALKQSTRNTLISSLANISNGGENTILSTNLNELSQVLRSLKNFGICQLDFDIFNDSKYDSGVCLSWDTSDVGVSSAYADFTLKVYSMPSNVTVDYVVNITTTVTVNGYYTVTVGDEKLVNLTCKVYNEGEPALFRNTTIFYESLGSWIPVNSSNNLSIMDYGNGTYTMSFVVEVSSDNVPVSVLVHDLRNIFVQANTTCYSL